MPARTNCAPPDILCSCGKTRAYPMALGLPPVGTESMCMNPKCARFWRLVRYDFTDSGGTRWIWDSNDPVKVEEPGALERTLAGIDETLLALALLSGPAMGNA